MQRCSLHSGLGERGAAALDGKNARKISHQGSILLRLSQGQWLMTKWWEPLEMPIIFAFRCARADLSSFLFTVCACVNSATLCYVLGVCQETLSADPGN